MTTQTSLVAEQVRLQQWAEQIRECQNRPTDMKVENWCIEHGITKANYYYRLKRVRKAFLSKAQNSASNFVELPVPMSKNTADIDAVEKPRVPETIAILHGRNDLAIEILSTASAELIRAFVGALAYAE